MWKYNDELYHYGVKGMRWGHRKRQQIITQARELADKRSKMYQEDIKRYNKNNSDNKRWRNASKNAKRYYQSKSNYYATISANKISRKEVKKAKQWINNNRNHEEAEFTDVYFKNKTENYLNDLYKFDKHR